MSNGFPCPKCGKDLDPLDMKHKLVPKKQAILVLKKEFWDAGYVGICKNCHASYTFSPEYYEQIRGKKAKGPEGFILPKS